MTKPTFSSVIEKLYQAALEPEAWLSFIDEFSNLTNLMGGQYFLWDEQAASVSYSVLSKTFPDVVNSQYAEYWGPQCPLLKVAFTTEPDRWLLCTRELDKALIAKSAYHHEYLFPTGIRYVTGYRSSSTTPVSSVLAWFRRPDQGPMGEGEMNWLRQLQPHFNTASRLHREMQRLQMNAELRERLLETLAYPVFLIYQNGYIAYMNRSAEKWLADNGFISVVAQCLTGKGMDLGNELARLINNVFVHGMSGVLAVPHREFAKPYQLMVMPLNALSHLGSSWQRPVASIVVADPAAQASLSVEQLQTLFGLTPAEAKIAIGLANGHTLAEMADLGDVSMNTVRSQLKQVLSKTGTGRQVELVNAVNALPKTRASKKST